MNSAPLTDLARALPASVPFRSPEWDERERGAPFRARLGANENLFGPSPAAAEAMARAAGAAWKYGDATCHDLREALAGHLDVPPAHIGIGPGIDGLLGWLVRLTVAPGAAVVTSDGAYPTFNYHVTGFGGALHKVPYRGDAEDIAGLTDAARRTGARLVYLCNPDNPMGSHHPGPAIARTLDDLPAGTLLVLDEAYGAFAPEGTLPAIDPADPRVIRMRSFSKAYGLAGARVGYAIGPADLIAAFERVRDHFVMTRMSLAGAEAALEDRTWLSDMLRRTDAARRRIGAIARENGLTPLPSATNFVAVDCGAGGAFARHVLAAMKARGVFLRMPQAPPGDRCIRVTAGPDAALDIFAAELPAALADARDAPAAAG